MTGTIVRIVSEAGHPVTFISDAGFESVRRNIKTLANRSDSTSVFILAGLLQTAPTRPIQSANDIRLPQVVFECFSRLLFSSCGEGEDTLIETLPARGSHS
jgi:hypothetical protein